MSKIVNVIVDEEPEFEEITSFEEIAQKFELMDYTVYMEVEGKDESTLPRPKRPKK